MKSLIILAWLWAGLFSCWVHSATTDAAGVQPEKNCQRFKNTHPLCLFTNPEDIAILADQKTLIVSEFGDSYGRRPGSLVFYNIENQQRRLAFAGGDAIIAKEYWGSEVCKEPPGKSFSPHGIDLSQRADGRWQLLVVQHGGRESIEFFEVESRGANVQLVWRGCAIAPKKAILNAVAAGMNDEFFTTEMHSTDYSWEGNGEHAVPTGVVHRWSKKLGFQKISGTEGVMLNGLAVSHEGNILYVIYSGENRLKKIDAEKGEILDSMELPSADNIKWSADGQTLLAASFTGSESSAEFARCMSPGVEICPITFAIIEVDPMTLAKKILFEDANAPMGAGTVGLKVGSQLFIGSFSGNRILQVDLDNLAR